MRMFDQFMAEGSMFEGRKFDPPSFDVSVFKIDNIYQVMADKPISLKELHCVAPVRTEQSTGSSMWFEWKSGNTMQGIHCMAWDWFPEDIKDTKLEDHSPATSCMMEALHDARRNLHLVPVRWTMLMSLFVSVNGKISGPVGWFCAVLNDKGKIVGNSWTASTASVKAIVQQRPEGTEDHAIARAILAVCVIPLKALAFMHCKNVETFETVPPAKSSAKRKKKTGHPLCRYQQVRLQVPRKGSSGGGKSGSADERAMHIVDGHFAHYGDCCEDHEPHKLLFGKHTGVYWVPGHVRGNPRYGSVVTERELQI